jgi:plastocyanin
VRIARVLLSSVSLCVSPRTLENSHFFAAFPERFCSVFSVAMATSLAASSSVSVASFCGLKADVNVKLGVAASVKMPAMKAVVQKVQASYTENKSESSSSSSSSGFQGIGMAVLAASAGLLVAASSANAATVKMGGDGGELQFVPSSLTVASGETVTFVNNAGFPHNLIFDEDNVPSGVNAGNLSREDYLNGPGEKVEVKLVEKGRYEFYCEPHQGAGMKGVITVT